MSRRGWLLFAAMCVLWGVPYLLIRVAVQDLSPAALVCARTGLGALLLLPLAVARGELVPALRRWRWLLVYTAVEVAIPWLFLSYAETSLSSSLSGLLVAAVPLVGVIVVRALGDDEPVHWSRVLGLLMGVVGVAALVGLDLGQIHTIALGEMAVVVVCYAVGPVILNRRLADLPAIGVVAASLAITALVYLPVTFTNPPGALPVKVIAAVAVLAVICTAVAFLVFFALIADIGPARATVITYVNPAVAMLLGVLLLHERLTVGMAVGFPLILAGSVLAARRRARPARQAVQPACAEVADANAAAS